MLLHDKCTFYKEQKATSDSEDTFKKYKYYQMNNVRVREDREDRQFFSATHSN